MHELKEGHKRAIEEMTKSKEIEITEKVKQIESRSSTLQEKIFELEKHNQ